MNATNVVFSKEAIKSLYLATRPSPNCGKWNYCGTDFIRENISIKDLIQPIFSRRPMLLASLKNYTQKHWTSRINKIDIVRLYCVFHHELVRRFVVQFRAETGDFTNFLRNDFILDNEKIYHFAFACLGRVGKVLQREGRICDLDCSLADYQSLVKNVVIDLPENTKYVALHFASAFAALTENEYHQIQWEQLKEFGNFFNQEQVDYCDWCGGDLTEFTLKTLNLL